MRRTGPSQAVRDGIYLRDGFRCVICQDSDFLQIHHRRPRGMGGTRREESNLPGNLILVCESCHMRIESSRDLARERGYLVNQREIPSAVPLIWNGEWTLLDDDGGTTPSLPLSRIVRGERRPVTPLGASDLAARDVLISDTSGEQDGAA